MLVSEFNTLTIASDAATVGSLQVSGEPRSESSLLRDLIVDPGRTISLRDIDPQYNGERISQEAARSETRFNTQRMDGLQYLMYAEKKHSLLIVLQGLDAAGKDGIVRLIMTA